MIKIRQVDGAITPSIQHHPPHPSHRRQGVGQAAAGRTGGRCGMCGGFGGCLVVDKGNGQEIMEMEGKNGCIINCTCDVDGDGVFVGDK